MMISRDELLDLLATKFKLFMHDQFLSTENISSALTGTGSVQSHIMDLNVATGILSASTAKIYYNINLFNPVYSTLIYRARMGSMANVRAFFGFKETTTDPDWAAAVKIKESSSGFMILDGKLYAYTSRRTALGPPAVYSEQMNEITGIDLTKDFLFKIIFNRFYTQPLPQVIPYFDGFRIETPDRIWSLNTTNSTYPPEDYVHYLAAFIENTVGEDKYLKLRAITYGEEYAD